MILKIKKEKLHGDICEFIQHTYWEACVLWPFCASLWWESHAGSVHSYPESGCCCSKACPPAGAATLKSGYMGLPERQLHAASETEPHQVNAEGTGISFLQFSRSTETGKFLIIQENIEPHSLRLQKLVESELLGGNKRRNTLWQQRESIRRDPSKSDQTDSVVGRKQVMALPTGAPSLCCAAPITCRAPHCLYGKASWELKNKNENDFVTRSKLKVKT